MKNLQSKRGRLPVLVAALALAAALGACHRNSDDDNRTGSQGPVAEQPNPPPVATDGFFAYVSQIVATFSDTAEPASTEGVTVTAPENTEPQPVPVS